MGSSLMTGVIVLANERAGRFAVRTETGGYTVFQLLAPRALLAIDDAVTGDLDALTVQTYRIRGVGDVNVFAEKCRLTRSEAQAWVDAG